MHNLKDTKISPLGTDSTNTITLGTNGTDTVTGAGSMIPAFEAKLTSDQSISDNTLTKINFDTGAVIMSGKDPTEEFVKYADFIGHIHISRPMLRPVNTKFMDHKNLSEKITAVLNTFASESICVITYYTADG